MRGSMGSKGNGGRRSRKNKEKLGVEVKGKGK